MLKVLEDRILVEPIEKDKVTASGLILAGDKEKPQEGIVVSANETYRTSSGATVDVPIKVGDKVIYSKYGGTEVEHQGKKYMLLALHDILATIEGEEDVTEN
jgi:chaperonin GroES